MLFESNAHAREVIIDALHALKRVEEGRVQGIAAKYSKSIHKKDGYAYGF